MQTFEEMKRYVRFTEADEERLRAFFPHVEPHLDAIVAGFYERVMEFEDALNVLRDRAQVERLQRTLKVWCRELLNGPWDAAYYERHRRIGQVHVAVGLPHRYMFTAMSVMRDHLCDIAEASGAPHALCASLHRITNLDLAVMCGTYMDERERRELTSLQHILVSHLPIAVLVVDQRGDISTSTEPAFRLLGVGPLIGRPWQEALPPTLVAVAELDRHVESALQSGNTVCLPRVDVALDGAHRSFRVDVAPIRHDQVGFLLYVEELTGTVQAEVRLQRAEALARLGSLSAAVAHELRNPLAGISGALQVLSRSFEAGDPRRGIMEQVLTQVRRMDALVRDLLTFSRPPPPHPADVDLFAVADEVARLMRQGQPELDLTISGKGRAWADPDHTHRILLNLVTNAAQATSGRGAVEIRVRPGGIVVQDDGPGVPEDVAPRIFEPFFTTRTQGTGLGLAICRQSADAMAGTLTLEPRPGGARFVLSLPQRAT
ncbi:MAG TPA: protoglobin domain-containing protein [Myxococcota bacterium]|nr:protoglobin domain-containing protein [Myxococcota bacterium]